MSHKNECRGGNWLQMGISPLSIRRFTIRQLFMLVTLVAGCMAAIGYYLSFVTDESPWFNYTPSFLVFTIALTTAGAIGRGLDGALQGLIWSITLSFIGLLLWSVLWILYQIIFPFVTHVSHFSQSLS